MLPVIVALALVLLPASAQAKEYLICAGTPGAASSTTDSYGFTSYFTYPKQRPRACDTVWGRNSEATSNHYLARLRWSSWGGPTARAWGLHVYKGPARRVKVVVSRPKQCSVDPMVSTRLYTRLTATTYYPKSEGGAVRHSMAMPAECDFFGDY